MSRARAWTVATITAAGVAATAVVFGWAGPAVEEACGEPALDTRFLWSAADAEALVAACGDAGLEVYRTLALLDLVFPALLGAMLVVWTLALSPGLSRRARILLASPAIVGALADYVEALGIWAVLNGATPSESWAVTVATVATPVKLTADAVALGVVVALLGRWAWRAVVTRRQRASGSPS